MDLGDAWGWPAEECSGEVEHTCQAAYAGGDWQGLEIHGEL